MRHLSAVVVAALLSSSSAFAQFTQQGTKLADSGAAGSPQQGAAVALSSDGNTAIVGGPSDGTNSTGAAWIWTRSGTSWAQQGSKLAPAPFSSGSFGTSVALSADGNTAFAGAPWMAAIRTSNEGSPKDKPPPAFLFYPGAAWAFTRTGGSWTQQGSGLTNTGSGFDSNQGQSVALSADGNTAVVGGTGESGTGAVFIYVRNGTTWSQQGPKLVGSDRVGSSNQGWSAALSADGNTAIVGGHFDNSLAGAAWVFIRSGSTWSQMGPKLTAPDPVGAAWFGKSVAISADGNTVAVGGPSDNGGTGAVWTFTRTASTFVPLGSKIVGAGSVGSTVHHGSAVSLSSHGDVLIEGGPGDGGTMATGAAWVFTRSGAVWTPLGSKLVGTGAVDGTTGANQGSSVALSSDGLTAIVGGKSDNNSAGAAWIFTRTLPPLPPHAIGDFDADGKADATLLKPNGDWSILRSNSGLTSSSVVNWSFPGFIPVRGDFDGDGKQDPALYNPATGDWRILKSSTNYTASLVFNWGGTGYTAAPGDYDGDGKADPAVYNAATGVWSILQSNGGYSSAQNVALGATGSTPIGGQDFDGDLVADIAVYRPSTGVWSVLKSSTAFVTGFDVTWGGPGSVLVPGDYDGDRKADLGLYDRATGAWHILTSSTGFASSVDVSWGGAGYLPVPGDYDGDARFDLGVFQPSTGNWYILLAAANFTTTTWIPGWGSSSDIPVSSAISPASRDLLRASDFDGDGRSEISVYHVANGYWSSLTSGSGYAAATNISWGGGTYSTAPGDYDGDGKTDLGIYHGLTGNWLVLLSSTNFTTVLSKNAGGNNWRPQAGDYDGDGKTDFVVYNETTGQWYGLLSSTNYTTTLSINFGGVGYIAVPADYDGDGRTDIGVYREATGDWSILLSSTNYTTSLSKNVGGSGYIPVQDDYDGDGKADFVTYNLATGLWYGLKSSTNYTTTINVSWGGSAYAPVKGDFDGDGKADLATYVINTGMWYILLSGSNYTTSLARSWGGSLYVPVTLYGA